MAQSLRKARREAKEYAAEAKLLLRRHGRRLEAEPREKIEKTLEELDAARKQDDAQRIAGLSRKLDEQVQAHLGFARKGPVRQYVESIAKAVLVALILRVFVIEAFKIPSGSMIPTLLIGDHIFVAKFAYGVRLPFINYQLYQARVPARGDVIVFNDPNPGEESKDLIKRVAGVPGDVITVEDEIVKVNGVPQPRQLLSSDYFYWDYHEPDYVEPRGYWFPVPGSELYREKMGAEEHLMLQRPDLPRPRPSQGPYVVPPGQIFVLGDNRDNSADSRYGRPGGWYVPFGNIKGKAFVIWLSVGKGGWWICHGSGPLCIESGIRFDRFFKPIR